MRTKPQLLALLARVAIAGLNTAELTPEDRADFYLGLSAILPETEAEAARYAATCIRESQRAQQDLLTAIETRKRAA
jgi:alkanesulfonate monooxygenase SsuD/methylene tetrahydromethanopterin reductase-like flavin-dependent oxidoreductase (luciferase family)